MLHINDLTYRIEGKPIFDKATAAIPAGHTVGFAQDFVMPAKAGTRPRI